MTDKSKPRRLSDIIVPGEDFAAKVKITEILNREVVILSIEKVSGSPEFSIVDEETGEVISRDYWNVEIDLDDKLYTFSCGAIPVNKSLTALQEKIDDGLAELPVLATFSKEGRTYVVS